MLNVDIENLTEQERLILSKAVVVWENPEMFPTTDGMSIEQIFELFCNVEEDKKNRDELTDSHIDYDDEIVEIVEIGEQECMDITVSGDNLFYANGILTKNSAGLPSTSDLMIGIIVTEQLNAMGQIQFKQLKNRFTDVTKYIKTIMGIDRPKMKLIEIEQNGAQMVNQGSVSSDTFDDSKETPPWEDSSIKPKDPFAGFQM